MIDALISGKLHGQPEQRTSRSGKPFTTARVRADTGAGEGFGVGGRLDRLRTNGGRFHVAATASGPPLASSHAMTGIARIARPREPEPEP